MGEPHLKPDSSGASREPYGNSDFTCKNSKWQNAAIAPSPLVVHNPTEEHQATEVTASGSSRYSEGISIAEKYLKSTRPFYSHSLPIRVVAKKAPLEGESGGAVPLPMLEPLPFAVCRCKDDYSYTGSNIGIGPRLRGCMYCCSEKTMGAGNFVDAAPKRLLAPMSFSPLVSKAVSPVEKPDLAEGEARKLISSTIKGAASNFAGSVSREELENKIRCLHKNKADHIFRNLGKDILRDKPEDPVSYMIDWLQEYRNFFGTQ